MSVKTDLLLQALEIMVVGMGGIFAALLIIYFVSVLLLKFFPED